MTKPYSPSCDRNKEPILKLINQLLKPKPRRLLEIGSGTGQHAVYFGSHLENVSWTPSDTLDKHEGILAWCSEANLKNINPPLEIEIGKDKIPKGKFDTLFSANVLHIISWEKVLVLFSIIDESFEEGAELIFYGPFNYQGEYTSQSNEDFDGWLKARDPESAIRSFEEVCSGLAKIGFKLLTDYEMPSNNRMLHFSRINP